ncbi:putative signal peptidase [Dioszegia hungarica]|uniref:Signal peptidase subunit 3 n=1 Tax=Dioszegia hungarica TaxID=4972 RepID=A0AA38LTJ7_9TREE|nr:putative signal peptidase [Dioszegia hungarica]KAI9634708.1 putative signal peptidase [Dioszegia hungarica]
MYSTLNRLNHLSSLATTYILILLGLISISSLITLPTVNIGKVDIKDLIVGRLRRWGAKEEDLATLRFDVRTDLNPLLNSYNTKQLFLYLTATYAEPTGDVHDVVLWDRIVTRADMRDFRAVTKKNQAQPARGKRGRGNVRLEEVKNKYPWKQPSGSFKGVATANFTLHYDLMPYVGLLSSGVAATARGPINIPEVIKR